LLSLDLVLTWELAVSLSLSVLLLSQWSRLHSLFPSRLFNQFLPNLLSLLLSFLLHAPSVKEREELEPLVLVDSKISTSNLTAQYARELESTTVDPLVPSAQEREELEPLEHVKGMMSTSREIAQLALEPATYHQESICKCVNHAKEREGLELLVHVKSEMFTLNPIVVVAMAKDFCNEEGSSTHLFGFF